MAELLSFGESTRAKLPQLQFATMTHSSQAIYVLKLGELF